MKWWYALAAAIVLAAVYGAAVGLSAESAVTQPIQFPHKTHVELDLQCTGCHVRAEHGAVAGRPPTAVCLSCHAGGDGTGEIKKIQAFEKGGEIPWKRVWRLPSHVFFPHRTHVVLAKVKCQTCHGPMETLDRPPAHALRKLTMGDCIGCHATAEPTHDRPGGVARRASTDCNACHR